MITPAEARLRALLDERVVGIVRVDDAHFAERAARALLEGGFRCIEITLTIPNALDLIRQLAAQATPDVLIGAGTVTSAAEARACIEAGAQFIVSPACEVEIIRPCREAGAIAIPGALTPSEILAAWRAGAHVVKVFPIHCVGGADYVRAVRGPFPSIPLWVSGLVRAEHTPELLAAGAQIVGLSASLIQSAAFADGDASAALAAAQLRARALGLPMSRAEMHSA